MYDLDDAAVRQRIAAQFGQGTLFSKEEILTLIHTYPVFELALIVTTYHDEACAFLLDASAAWQCMIALLASITRHLSDADRAAFDRALKTVVEGCTVHDEGILGRLPTFGYVPRGKRIGVHITFPETPST